MLKKILGAIGVGSKTSSTGKDPYSDESANLIYNQLFCDQLSLYKDFYNGDLTGPWRLLFKDQPDTGSLVKLAGNSDTESRVRALAFNILRAKGKKVPEKILLGTIVEVHLPEGLDTLAVFTDGSARYINHTGKIAVVDGPSNVFDGEIAAVIATSKPIIDAIGPWDRDRLDAPREGNIRMSFLVSDGLYFGEGPMDKMQKEQMASPLIKATTSLLVKIVNRTSSSEHHQ